MMSQNHHVISSSKSLLTISLKRHHKNGGTIKNNGVVRNNVNVLAFTEKKHRNEILKKLIFLLILENKDTLCSVMQTYFL